MTDTKAIIAKRVDSGTPDTDEIRDLAEAAGYIIVHEIIQVRPEDSTTHFGSGKVVELSALVAERGATMVIVDGELTPAQNHSTARSNETPRSEPPGFVRR
ncbi:hypothetical protein C2R22_21035 (plasmid) [Salinigranum rubrum]|uniref:GTPase HflX N-terminal domain-containing protein n=1 Tax=Salinigranum rubrum TaxID=755307 RepID=A0A2I8VQ84_9EURY|nr:hypothetical protein [Salinigranum rubrum]AUV84087.1 hypothetical protein C2R22_21035 [Salinigranum rubrum]